MVIYRAIRNEKPVTGGLAIRRQEHGRVMGFNRGMFCASLSSVSYSR
jgi:hypothetical protein